MEFRIIEMPERRADVPKPRITATRRVDLPDGAHFVEIVGGYSHAEQQFWAWLMRQWMGLREIADAEERARAENDLNAYFATFLDLHIVTHNLTYPGTDEPLPETGWALFWELPGSQSLDLCRLILNPPSPFDAPKAGASSTTG